jgi:4a-hydroxytetrahydrobiopterin dehydratase
MPQLSPSRIRAALRQVPCWRLRHRQIVRKLEFKDFAAALRFVNRVGRLAEAAAHHPDIDLRWNQVTLKLTTHSAGGLTEKDFRLATQIDRVA